MKKELKFSAVVLFSTLMTPFISCDKNDDYNGPDEDAVTTIIGFRNAPSNLFGSSTYGENLYDGNITKGYLVKIHDEEYAQFSVNYGYNYDADFNLSWCYTLYNGGFALSKYHDMTGDTYNNQLSVYNPSSPSGGNFVVANGSSLVADPKNAKYSDYDGCAKVYITNAQGYGVGTLGQERPVDGEDEDAWFRSVWITNTTYTYLTMKNGNAYSAPLNEENEGWFKVQFIAFEDNDPDNTPLGYTEAYLANFKKGQADGYTGIIEEWIKVDLSMLPECSILVVNFAGSDSSEWGLNTPAYCALDNFEISVEK